MSLTILDHTMQRGAYEAAYLGRPVITSNFAILRSAFPKGAVFVNNEAESLAQGVEEMRDQIVRFESEARELAREKRTHWKSVRATIESLVVAAEE